MTKVTIFHTSPYAAQQKASSSQEQMGPSLSFEEFRTWVKSGKIFAHLFRYSESRLITYDMRLIAKPFILLLLVKLLARGKAYCQDQEKTQIISGKLLVSLFIKFVSALFRKNKFIRSIKHEVSSLSPPFTKNLHRNKLKNREFGKEAPQNFDAERATIAERQGASEPQNFGVKPTPPKTDSSGCFDIDWTKPPVYLRTDLCFGLQSGGSVGHIAGVLNHFSLFVEKPIFLTSDLIPTVHSKWETHVISPGHHFWDFSELPAFDYNHVFVHEALKRLGSRTPSFIYQRYSLNNYSGIHLAKHYRVPFVLEFNGSEVWVARNWGGRLKYERLSQQIEEANLQAADLVVVVSQALKDTLVGQGLPEAKILVNPNGVDPDRYAPTIDGSKIRQKLGIEKEIVLGFIGTFGKWHGAEVLAEAFGKLLQSYPEYRKNIRLLMIGEGFTLPWVRKTLQDWNVLSSCILTGTIPQADGPSYLAACDIFVSPHVPNSDGTPFFGSPTKLFEYMAMGKGIVASNLDQIGEILMHNESALLVTPGDSTSLMLALQTLIDDPPMRSRLGRAARKKIIDHYSWKEHTRKIIDRLSATQSHPLPNRDVLFADKPIMQQEAQP